MIKLRSLSLVLQVLAVFSLPVSAEETYSPRVNQIYPDKVYWGDTHLHTYLSGDAFALGSRLTPDDAYRFARGEVTLSTGGMEVRLRRPLDFLMIADHAENLGVLPRLAAGDTDILKTEHGQYFSAMLAKIPLLRDVLTAASREEFDAGNRALGQFKAAWGGDYSIDADFKRDVWHEVVDLAEKYNDPGRFTTFAGFEYSSNPPMLHRNVMFVGGPEQTKQILPFSKYDSYDPEDLWAHLQEYKDRVGSDVIAIPHNSNLSRGNMFRAATYQGKALTTNYAKTRSSMEPIIEVTQIKGDSETHPFISPDDEFADYESWGKYGPAVAKASAGKKPSGKKKPLANKKAFGNKKPLADKKPLAKPTSNRALPTRNLADATNTSQEDLAKQSYARSALKLGLGHQAKLGINPFKFGMIGSTDSHTGLATADEDNFWGKMGANEPGPYRSAALAVFTSSGYAGVWAQRNTRESLFAAMKRREVYATTGPRITLRFFGGWEYARNDALSPDFAAIGYRKGVPMGGDLVAAGDDQTPVFLVRAVKDPDGANLDRVQIIKGWRDNKGELLEKVYDVAWSGDRKPGKNGKLPAVGSTVDLVDASYTNSIGTAELSAAWTDPDFNRREASFYYVRVIEIPTPRWTVYDAKFYGLNDIQKVPSAVQQERAYSSPIWYTP